MRILDKYTTQNTVRLIRHRYGDDYSKVSYLSHEKGRTVRFILQVPSILPPGMMRGKAKGEFLAPVKNELADEILLCSVYKLKTPKEQDCKHILILPYRWGSAKSLGYIIYRDQVRASNPEFLVDAEGHELWKFAEAA